MKKITFNIAVLIALLLTANGAFAQVPTITSFAPTSGSVGTTVTITGSNFNTSFTNNIVFFGATKATVSAGSATSLTVAVPTGASYQPISVTNITTGLTAYSAQPFIVTFPCGGVIDATSFAPKVNIYQVGSPMSVSTGDLDGDGKTDLAVANYNNTVSVFRNTGNSGTISFATSMNFTTGTNPYSVLTGDLDGDGKLDLVVANYNSNTVSVFRNTGSSGTISFAAKVDFTTGTNPLSVSTHDLDGDGKTDLAVTNYNSNTVSLFRNTGSSGTISFAAKVDINTAINPMSVSTGDLDGDGKPDLAVAHEGSNTLSVFRNTGSSGTISFATSVNFSTWAYPISVSIADLDGDGKLDLANVNAGAGTVTVFRNTGSSGTISFAAPVISAAGTNPNSISTSDFNGDGKLDLAVANRGSNNASVFGNTGSSGTISFATKVDYAADVSSSSVSTGDFDGDGKPDLAVANASSSNVSVFRNLIAGVPPIVTANATATTVCAGASITLTGAGTANTYAWSGGVTNGVGSIPPTGTTTYTVTGTVTATGCQNTATITITVITTLPIVTANATATTVCAGTSITLTGGGTANTYAWSGGVTNGVGFIPPTGTTSYTVTGTAGCQNTATITITVNPSPTVTANSTATTVCAGASITLTGGGANTYVWTGGVTDGVGFVPPTGVTTYTVTGTDLNGCSNTATKNITVNPIPIATFSSTPTTKCSGACNATATIMNVTGGQSPYTYQWDANANNQTTSTASFLCQGYYSVIVTDANLCSVTENVQIDVATVSDPNIYLTNLAAIDQINISPSFAAFYTYNLPASITAPPSNPRNFVDPGKKARFKVECTNEKFNGQSIVSGICKVRSNNPYITITDSSSALNNIGWNDKAWSADEFEINIDPNTPPGTNAYIDFIVQESGQEYSTTCIAIPITPLVYSQTTPFTIDDDSNPDSQGNDNDICDPNEIIEFYPWLDNISTLDAEFVRGRFENLDSLSYINIWNGVPGINTTVYDAGWWNYSFAQPQTINSNSFNTTPEYDFVFNYNYPFVTDFKLYMVMAGGFKLFSGTALSLVQWSLPYTFSGTGSTSIASEIETNGGLSVYPNPTNGNVQFSMNNGQIQNVKVYNQVGALVYQSEKETQELNLTGYPKGVYLIQVQSEDKVFNKKLIIH